LAQTLIATPKTHGFTLLEVMVSLAIFALLSTACYQFLQSLVLSRAATLSSSEQRMELETSLLILEQDMRHLIPRSIRSQGDIGQGENAERVPALTNRLDNLLEFSRAGLPVGRSTELHAPGRVSYHLEESEQGLSLQRRVYQVLDKVESSPSYQQQLLSEVTTVSVRFLDEKGAWRETWPADAGSDQQSDPGISLPVAVEFALTLRDEEPLLRVVSLR
jgi:general secretion pathway protein J